MSTLYGNKFPEPELHKPVSELEINNYITKITNIKKINKDIFDNTNDEVILNYIPLYLNDLLSNICNVINKSFDFRYNNHKFSGIINIIDVENYKRLMLGDIIQDTNELDDLIAEYKIIKKIIEFSEISVENILLLNEELDIILNNYIVDNNIDEDSEYQHLNLHNYKNLKSSDLYYLHNKYILDSNIDDTEIIDNKCDIYMFNSIVGTLVVLSGYILYNVL